MKNPALRFLSLAARVAILLAFAPSAATAERKKEPLPEIPPAVPPLALKVQRGETAEIQLRIIGSKNEPLKFLIRTPPEHGRVTEPRALNPAVGVVTYTPPTNPALVRDHFFYAVQTSAGVSASAEVLLTIVDPVPQLAFPERLDFPPTLAGTAATRPLEITNRGGGVAEGKVTIEAPWKIDGPTTYRLTAGARAVFKIIFTPDTVGTFDTLLRCTSQPEASITVHGEALAPLTATPAKIVLQPSVGDPVRAASFELTNPTGTERRVKLAGGPRLQLPADLAVPAQSSVKVPVVLAASDVAALEDEIRVESAGFTFVIPVRASAVGPIVRAGRASVQFGRVDATTSTHARLELENIGGTPANLRLEIATPFTTEPVASLAPGEKTVIILHTQPGSTGTRRALLKIHAGPQTLEIPVEAELGLTSTATAQPAGETPTPIPLAELPPSVPPKARRTPLAGDVPEYLRDHFLPVPGVKIAAVTAHSATLEWPAALHPATQFRVEYRILALDPEGELQVRWAALPGTVLQRIGDHYQANLRDLQSATPFALRVVPLPPDGEAGAPLFTHLFHTLPPRNLWSAVTPLRLLLVALGICGAFVLRHRRAERRRP